MIVFSEHYIFRKGNFANYDLESWNDPKRLPMGIAGFVAFALGVVAWIMGMVQTWVSDLLDMPVVRVLLANRRCVFSMLEKSPNRLDLLVVMSLTSCVLL